MSAPADTVYLVDDATRLRTALNPIRRRLLAMLDEPASATELAARCGMPRQQVNYHLRVLEDAHLVELVEERRRRGCVERRLRASAAAFVVDPDVLGPPATSAAAARDAHSADHLVATASTTVRDVTRMRAAARAGEQRLLTFTIASEVRFARPADVHAFTDELARALEVLVERFHTPAGRPYRVVAGGHPAAAPSEPTIEGDSA